MVYSGFVDALVLALDTYECKSWIQGPVPQKIKILFDCWMVEQSGELKLTFASLC